MRHVPARLDHLVFAVTDLEAGRVAMERLTGVRPSVGGRHVGFGTRNVLLALGPERYLEVIGPDPEQPDPPGARPFGIDTLMTSRLVHWAVHESNIEQRVAAARAAGYEPGDAIAMSRKATDGSLLEWKLAASDLSAPGPNLVPFLLEWGQTSHPSTSAAAGATLVDFRAEHPDPDGLAGPLAALDVDLSVAPGPEPRLIAVIETPAGTIELS